MNKAELLTALQAGRAELEAMWDGANEAQLVARPGPQADWSVKDLIAHLTYWEQDTLRQVQDGAEVTLDKDVDAINAQVFNENCDRSLKDILADFKASYADLVTCIEECTDEALAQVIDDKTLAEHLAYDSYEHYPEHLGDLQSWRARAGLAQ